MSNTQSKKNVLVTGGAGFIGSNLVASLLDDKRVNKVRVIDNLSNGYVENLKEFSSNNRFEFVKGDIRDIETCRNVCEGMDLITHQAALGSVSRSIENPMLTTEVNILGTVNIMYAAVENKIERVVLAFSSSTYGDHKKLPKIEDVVGNPLSPYAVTKSSIEYFAYVFGKIYGLKWIGLRYFNVFGPKQNPKNPYAAVIPIFCDAFINNNDININGDGLTSRDFTYIDNAIHMNLLSLFTENKKALNNVYNTACNQRISLNELVSSLEKIFNKKQVINFRSERPGDVKHSLASITKAKNLLGYSPIVSFHDGLQKTVSWYLNEG